MSGDIDVDSLPFESWEKLPKEGTRAFGAFCVYRDFGGDRSIKKALISVENSADVSNRLYRMWLNWSGQFHWVKRAGDYDRYLDKLKFGLYPVRYTQLSGVP